jgi:hypothetical protein
LSGLPTLPQHLNYLWNFYQELQLTRYNNGWSAQPLTYTEIYSWSKLRRILLDAWELDSLLKLDDLFLSIEAKAQEQRQNNGGS